MNLLIRLKRQRQYGQNMLLLNLLDNMYHLTSSCSHMNAPFNAPIQAKTAWLTALLLRHTIMLHRY